jgi:hypothetical protein
MKKAMTFWETIKQEAGDEAIEAVVIGGFASSYFSEKYQITDGVDVKGIPAAKHNVRLTEAEASRYLDYDYDGGYGGVDVHAVYAWTASRVLFVAQYDGKTWPTSVPRSPGDSEPSMPGG